MYDVEDVAELFVESEELVSRERAGRRLIARYRLRASGASIFLRHGTTDLGVVDEIFGWRLYELPDAVAQVLAGLGRPPRVLDLGGHIGVAALYLLDALPGAVVTSFEPDRFNFGVLELAHAAHPDPGAWQLVRACAGNRDGELGFREGAEARSRIAPDADAATSRLTVRDVLPALATTDLLKLDMEGGEWAILEDPRFADLAPAVVALEYHPDLCPAASARAHAEALLDAAGYAQHHLFEKPDGVGMLWAWRA